MASEMEFSQHSKVKRRSPWHGPMVLVLLFFVVILVMSLAFRVSKIEVINASEYTDEEIISAQQLLGRREGVCVEPASAASVAGLRKLRQEGIVDRDERVVCICTGNGLKDPDTIINNCAPPIKCGNSVADVERILSQD